MKRPLEFALGVIGGFLGIAFGCLVMILNSMGGSVTIGNLGISAIIFSVIGIIGAFIVVNGPHTKVAGWLMIIAGVGILALGVTLGEFGPFYSVMSGIPLIIAGLMAAFKKTKV